MSDSNWWVMWYRSDLGMADVNPTFTKVYHSGSGEPRLWADVEREGGVILRKRLQPGEEHLTLHELAKRYPRPDGR